MIITPNIGSIERRLCARMKQWAPQLAAAELCFGIDPFTLAAIIDRESQGGEGLTPRGPAGRAPTGFGLALLDQDRHVSFLLAQFEDGQSLWSDPSLHILYVARVLKRYLDLFAGDYPAAIAAYDSSVPRVRGALARRSVDKTSISSRVLALDTITTDGNYVSDVLSRRAEFIGATLQ